MCIAHHSKLEKGVLLVFLLVLWLPVLPLMLRKYMLKAFLLFSIAVKHYSKTAFR
jgi:hypothetical protein